MRSGGISFLVSSFDYAVGLARGEPDIDKPEQGSVRGVNMLVAHAYAQQINRICRALYWKFFTMPWPPLARETARDILTRATEAATRFEVETRLRCPLNEQQER